MIYCSLYYYLNESQFLKASFQSFVALPQDLNLSRFPLPPFINMKKNLSLTDILGFYATYLQSQHPQKKAQEIISQTETAINRYTLPGWGLEPFKGRKPTRVEKPRSSGGCG